MNHESRTNLVPPLRDLGTDLLRMHPIERVFTILLPFAWFAAYFVFACLECWPAAIVSLVALSFVTYGSTSHDLVHRSLGLSKRTNDFLLCITEFMAIRSGHAYQAAHLHHHAAFPAADDVESTACRHSWYRAIADGVLFQPRIWLWALRHAEQSRGWIVFEGFGCLLLIAGSLALMPITPIFAIYVALMIAGSWVIPFATSFVPHNPDVDGELFQTRAFRGIVASVLAVGHLYHLEHHLYPAVPHRRWPRLAKRLDPYLQKAGVRPVRFWF